MRPISARRSTLTMAAFAGIANLLWSGATCAATELAAVYCAHDAAQLSSLLSDAGNGGTANGHDNVIHLVSTTFLTNGGPFSFNSSSGFALTLEGGYDFNCINQDLTPGQTVLDGGGPPPNGTPVLSLQSSGDVTVRRLTIQNGYRKGSSNGGGAGIYLANESATAVFDDNQVLNNASDYAAGGLTVFGSGTVHIDGNLFAGNNAPAVAAAFPDMNAGSIVYFNNNTITGNVNTNVSSTSSTALGGGSASGYAANNISYDNTGTNDFYLYSSGTFLFVDNDYHSINGTPAVGGRGNVDVDPLFVGAGNYHLAANSPLRAAGTAGTAGALPAADLDGHAFPLRGRVDMGAYNEILFADGFEMP